MRGEWIETWLAREEQVRAREGLPPLMRGEWIETPFRLLRRNGDGDDRVSPR